jgi:hypothetical protein
MQCKDSATVRSERNEPSASERPRHVPNFNFLFSCFSPLISSHQHQNRPLPLNHQRNISANKCPPFPPSHPLLSSPSLLPLPLSTFGKRRSSLAAARQLYALVETSILSILHSANDFLSFFCTFGAVLMLQIALADSGLSIGMVYVFIAGVLLVKEGIASNSEYVLLLFSRFCVIHSLTHRHLRLRDTSSSTTTASLRWDHCPNARCDHSFSLSSHSSPFHWTTSPSRGLSLATADADKNLDDVVYIPAPWDAEVLEQFHRGTAPH